MSDHGYVAYTHGCRCEVCREAKRLYMAERRATGAEPTRVGEVARPAWHDQAHRGRPRVGLRRIQLSIPNHGTTTGYRRGCRCWECTDAAVCARRDRHARRKTAAA